jgi:DNA-binding PadR family transcriptional regulator
MAKNEMVCLGLIYSEPCHTYALDGIIKEFDLEQWANISKASIYNTLARLEYLGCVKVTTEKVGKMPERKVYAITDAGKKRLLQELRESMMHPASGDNLFYLAMCFCFGMDAEETIQILQGRINNLNNAVEKIKNDYKQAKKYNVYNWIILSKAGLKHIKVEIETAKEFINLFKEHPDCFNDDLTGMYRAMIQKSVNNFSSK